MQPPPNPNMLDIQMNPEEAADTKDSQLDWYLYAITLGEVASGLATNLRENGGGSLLMVEQGKLAAVTGLVPHDEFSPEAVQARAQDLTWLEAAVRNHNEVVARIHQAGAVLPVKFGSVYPSSEALQADLAEMHEALFAQLERIQNCDEWGIHLYAHHQTVQRLAGLHPRLQHLQSEVAAASPGRAYLLKRKLTETMTDIAEQALSDLAQASYRRLVCYAVAGQVSSRPALAAESDNEREVLHATFLVHHSCTEGFLQEIQQVVQEQEGLRCEYSGPWPPYSFASISGGKRHE